MSVCPPAPPGLRVRSVRPGAPCPVARRASLRAHRASAPSSFREPTLTVATISTELSSSALYPPKWNWILRRAAWDQSTLRPPPSPVPLAPAFAQTVEALTLLSTT